MFRKLRAMMYATYPQMVKKKMRGVGVKQENTKGMLTVGESG